MKIPMLTAILSLTLLCCSKKQDNEPEPNAGIAKVIRDFENRRTYDRLSPDILSQIPDDKLEQAIIDFIYAKVGDDPDREFDIISKMSAGFRAVASTWWVEAEVNNGGFNQFFWNPSRVFAKEAVSGFELLGEPKLAELMKNAIAINAANDAKFASYRSEGSLEAFSESYKDNPLNALDDQFYAATKQLSADRVRFIRSHPELFVGE